MDYDVINPGLVVIICHVLKNMIQTVVCLKGQSNFI